MWCFCLEEVILVSLELACDRSELMAKDLVRTKQMQCVTLCSWSMFDVQTCLVAFGKREIEQYVLFLRRRGHFFFLSGNRSKLMAKVLVRIRGPVCRATCPFCCVFETEGSEMEIVPRDISWPVFRCASARFFV